MTACMLLAGLAACVTSCQKKDPAAQVKGNGLPQAQNTKGLIAYVEVDSLATQYEYCKVCLKELEAKQAQYSSQLNSKAQALQKAMADFQQKMQSGGYTSQQQAEAAQAQLQRQDQQLRQFQEKVEADMAAAAAAYQETLRDSLKHFIDDFNKDGRYTMILSKSGDNILYADKQLDITDQVVAGLNKRYKK